MKKIKKRSNTDESTLPDLSAFEGILDYGQFDPALHTIEVELVVGLVDGGEEWRPDWTLNTSHFRSNRGRLVYHRRKLDDLVGGWRDKGLPPITQEWLLSPRGYRLIGLIELEGFYFVETGIHRAAAAHLLGFRQIRGTVTHAKLKRSAPPEAKAWLMSLGDL